MLIYCRSHAQADTLLDGLVFVAGFHDPPVEVESDCLSLVNLVNSKSLFSNLLGSVLVDISDHLALAGVISFSYIARDCSPVAHRVAWFKRMLVCCSRVGCFPS